MRVCGAPDQQQDRHEDGDHDALEDSQQKHRRERDHRHAEFPAAHSPHVAQLPDVDQSLDGDQHDAASTTFGRLASKPVRYIRHRPMVIDANTSASGVRAPALSFTDDCERPPATG